MKKLLWVLLFFSVHSIAQKPKLVIKTGHASAIYQPVYSQDGKYIITTSDDGSAKIWDAATGELVRTFRSQGGRVTEASLSPDNSQLTLIDADFGVSLTYDTRTEKLLEQKDIVTNATTYKGFGVGVSITRNNAIYIYNPRTDKEVLIPGSFFAFSVDTVHSVLYAVKKKDDRTITLEAYTFPYGTPRSSSKHMSFTKNICFDSYHNKMFAIGSGGILYLLSPNLEIQKALPITKSQINYSVFSQVDGSVIACVSEDSTIKVLNTKTGKMVLDAKSPKGLGFQISFSPDNTLLSVDESYSYSFQLYDLKKGGRATEFDPADSVRSSSYSYKRQLEQVLYPPGKGTIIIVYSNGLVKEFGLADHRLLRQRDFQQDVGYLSFNPAGEELVGFTSADYLRFVSVFDLKRLEKKFDLFRNEKTISAYCFDTATNKVWFGRSNDDHLYILDLKTSVVQSIAMPVIYSRAYSYSVENILLDERSGRIITTGSDKCIRVWNARTAELIKGFQASDGDIITASALSADGKLLATGTRDAVISVWDMDSFKLVKQYGGSHGYDIEDNGTAGKTVAGAPSHWSSALSFNNNARYLASNYYGKYNDNIIIYDLNNDGSFFTATTQANDFRKISFDKATDHLLVRDDYRLAIIDAPSGKIIYQLTGKNYDPFFENVTQNESADFTALNEAGFLPGNKGLFLFYDSIVTIKDANTFKTTTSRTMPDMYAIPDNTGYIEILQNNKVQSVLEPGSLRTICDEAGCLGQYLSTYRMNVTYASSATGLRFYKNDNVLASLISLDNNGWVIIDSAGRFDATPEAMHQLYFTVNSKEKNTIAESIELNQLKHRYYQPGLLPVLLGFKNERLRFTPELEKIELAPKAQLSINEAMLTIRLQDQDGGIGKVSVFIDNTEIIEDAVKDRVTKNTLSIDLSKYASLINAHEANTIKVITYNAGNWLSSKPYAIQYIPTSAKGVTITSQGKKKEAGKFYAVVIGISDYAGTALDLHYAAKDAQDFAKATTMTASNLFGKENTQVFLLQSDETTDTLRPTKTNFKRILQGLSTVMQPQDILLLYLSGHGVNYGGQDGDFYYLTADASAADAEYLKDPVMREMVSVSSNELTALLNKIAARKKVLVLDACASGKAAEMMSLAMRDIPASQVRALDRMADRTGFYILSGAAADAVSYEAGMYGQGLLTYALLKGLKGAATRQDGNEEYADVQKLLEYAVDEVPKLAAGIGGIQQPLYRNPGDQKSYDIGLVNDATKKAIVIAEPKPVFMAAGFINISENEDDLQLGKLLNAELREITAKGKEAPVIFTEAKDYPGAWKLSGNYKIEGNNIVLTYRLRKDDDKTDHTISGDKKDLPGFTKKIIAAVIEVVSAKK